MPNILHAIETTGPGGAETVVLNLLRSLEGSPYRSTVLLQGEGWLSRQINALGIEPIVLPQSGMADVHWFRFVKKLIAEQNIRLIHAHEFMMNVYCSMIASVMGLSCVTTVHGKNYYGDKWRRRAAYRYASRRSCMVAVSSDIKHYLVDCIGARPDDVGVIHNGVDVEGFAPNAEVRMRVRQELKIPHDCTLLGAVGNLYQVKGHSHLIKALARVIPVWPNFRLFIAGRGEEMGALQEEARRLGLAEHVMLLGFRDDVAALIQAMDIFVMPSESEGIPLALLEAMAAQKPVVVTDVGGMPEVVTDLVGKRCPPKDPAALADCLLKLLRDPELAHRLGLEGRKRVQADFSIEKMYEQYVDRYEAMIRGAATRCA
jgi:glycosyltransferase involved in cell wall biosynthesis